MGRVQRIRYIFGLAGLAVIAYLIHTGLRQLAYLGLVLGFTAGFLLDASTREKSLIDNMAAGLVLSAAIGYADLQLGITQLARELLGIHYILAMLVLAAVTLLGALVDEVRIGRTVRISYLPTLAIIFAIFLLFSAVSVNQAVHYTRTSHFDGTRTTGLDTATRYNDSTTVVATYSPTPVVDGIKAVNLAATIANPTLSAVGLAIYRVSNTTRVRHPGTLEINFTLSVNTSVVAIKLLFYDNGAKVREISANDFSFNRSSLAGFANFSLSSTDVYYANISDFVMLYIDLDDVATSSVSVSISAAIIGERVLNKTYAYLALLLEALAAILAIPEDTIRTVRRIRVRRRSRRR